MSAKEMKRLAIQDEYIKQLYDAADDPGLNDTWKVVVMRGILQKMMRAVAALEKEAEA